MEDYYDAMVKENYALLENLHEQCFTKCSKKTDLSYLSMAEGVCFRNCINKFNNWYPRFQSLTEGAAFKTYHEMTLELESELKKQ